MIAAIISTLEPLCVTANSRKAAAKGNVSGLLKGHAVTIIVLAVARQRIEGGGAVDDEAADFRVIGQAVDFRLPLCVKGLVTR